MAQVKVSSILRWIENEFEMNSIDDIAINGIQIENSGLVNQIISAVDFSLDLLNLVNREKKILFLVHHGLFWGKPFPITGRKYKLLQTAFKMDSVLLALHLPLDIHPKWGNNVSLAKILNLSNLKAFGPYKGTQILLSGEFSTSMLLTNLVEIYKEKVGNPISTLPFGSKKVQKIGICTGGGLFGLKEAKDNGCDTFVTGDANHTSVELCKELQINLISGGHYNTEQYGVQALGRELEKTFKIKHRFIDLPTGL